MSVRVMIADSSSDAREVMRHHLDCMGCNVVAETDNAAQTADLFRTIRPQVVILDVDLKGGGDLDALGLVHMIRAESPDSAVIVVSPAGEPQRSQPFMDQGALECLVEPLANDGFERVWRKLRSRFPELRPPELAQSKAARRPSGNPH
ncbi:MAG TPA: response regulator [Candidatus Binataceae bacterium]|nr:response regulator [Candidatus Binataceae bacterium]